MNLQYSPSAKELKSELINEYSILDEIKRLEKAILDKPDIVKTNKYYQLSIGQKFKVYKRSYNVLLSSNIVISNLLVFYFIKVKDNVFITDIKFNI
ncbi:hypothetical protein EPJ76_11850 [Brachyspira aalborgi]|uniref:Uncharacterized protein n=1 Tax=Brachyspira aalborgi TaxID=29522 RepID=A0A5C8FUU4_9SPIR|nr:hypothetical protein EPJ76_11850 [Brachyspira aalborgi]